MIKVLIAALLVAPLLSAQVVTATDCVHHAGYNPDWARPDFDDRHWSKQIPAIGSPHVWTRCRLDLRTLPPTGPILIGVNTLIAWELCVDGQPAGSFGDIRSGFASAVSRQHRPVSNTVTNRETVTLALRLLPGRHEYWGVPQGATAEYAESTAQGEFRVTVRRMA